ncbi:exported hypothetical protein [Clostridium neonatale]|nr:exported hypothetical protein [Clostridium neonatale]CAI3691828.1 exported hypothetical protein [Clostridium neonatale]
MIKRKKGILKICTMLLTGALILSGCSSNSNNRSRLGKVRNNGNGLLC